MSLINSLKLYKNKTINSIKALNDVFLFIDNYHSNNNDKSCVLNENQEVFSYEANELIKHVVNVVEENKELRSILFKINVKINFSLMKL